MDGMRILGQIGELIYVADVERDVLFTVDASDTVAVVDGTTPDRFLKFSGAYLRDPDRDQFAAAAAVERSVDMEPPPLPATGTPPDPDTPTHVVGEIAGDPPVDILSADPPPAGPDTEVWLADDPATVTTMDAVEATRTAVWDAPRDDTAADTG